MASEFSGLRTCIYLVHELERATVWYSKVFDTEPYFKEPFYVGFNIGGYELGLQPEEKKGNKADSVLTYWGVEDVEKTFSRLIQAGATEHSAPQNVGGEIVVASVKDPWDNVVGIIFNPGFKIK
jgi:predicted enzyme related to lactoylglutathione lyase